MAPHYLLYNFPAADESSPDSYNTDLQYLKDKSSSKRFRAYKDQKVVKTDLGPPKILKSFTRPPLAGPYAFSRIPKPHWNRPRVNVPHEIENTWLFLSTQAG